MNTAFEKNKLQRQLDMSGKDYDFYRREKNEYGDFGGQDADGDKIGSLRGLYHEVNAFMRLRMTDTTQVRQSVGQGNIAKQPRILCLFESVAESGLQFGDYTIINGKRFNVTAVTNVQEWNIIADISLEVVDDGNNVSL